MQLGQLGRLAFAALVLTLGTAGIAGAASADDHPNSLAGPFTAADVVVPGGDAVNGSIETAGDVDVLQVSLAAGSSYTFTVALGTLADSVLELRNSSGWTVAANDEDPTGVLGHGSRIANFVPTASGTYYLRIYAWRRRQTGTYKAAVTAPTSVADLAVSRLSVSPANPSATSAVSVELAIRNLGTAASPAFSYGIWLDGRSAVTRRASSGVSAGATLTDSVSLGLLAAGRHSVLVRADTSSEVADPNRRNNALVLSFSVTRTPVADDHPNTPSGPFSAADVVTVDGVAVAGNIETARDADFFQVALTTGDTYTFEVPLGTLRDSMLELRDPSGALVAFNDDDPTRVLGWGSRIAAFKAAATGNYTLGVRAYSLRDTGTYKLSAHH